MPVIYKRWAEARRLEAERAAEEAAQGERQRRRRRRLGGLIAALGLAGGIAAWVRGSTIRPPQRIGEQV